jgi:hypothetical protein
MITQARPDSTFRQLEGMRIRVISFTRTGSGLFKTGILIRVSLSNLILEVGRNGYRYRIPLAAVITTEPVP